MNKYLHTQVAVIGAGPAGLAAAAAAAREGAQVMLIERDHMHGGILNQCIHDGFGIRRYGEMLTGPEYVARAFSEMRGVELLTDTMVLSLNADRTLELSSRSGYRMLQTDAVVIATGCRERPAGAILLPGMRPSGIYTAGVVQNLMNMQNLLPGRRALILGSGDIGLIMARRLTLEGAAVAGCYEMNPWPGGLPRNIRQCLDDYSIPLNLSSTVIEVRGSKKLEGCLCAKISQGEVVAGSEHFVPCDLLVLSVGLIPENERAREAGVELSAVTGGAVVDENLMTSVPGIFACGNALHVHDLVDFVSDEAQSAGISAAHFSMGKTECACNVPVSPGHGVHSVLPHYVSAEKPVTFSIRITEPKRQAHLIIEGGGVSAVDRILPRVSPAEMIRIALPLEKIPGNEMSVRIE